MTPEQFDAFSATLKAHAERSPAGFRLRTVWAGVIGVILQQSGALFITVAVCVGVFLSALKHGDVGDGLRVIAWVGPITLGILTIMMWWQREPPIDGIRLERRDAPELFDEVDRIVVAVGCSRIHRIIIDGTVNAAMVPLPRWYCPGFFRHGLLLGLPLLRCLSVEEARSVIAHEMGHLAKAHHRTTRWIWRLRMSWERTAARRIQAGQPAFSGIADRYWPWFNAHALILSRDQERAADAVAAAVTSAAVAARALLRIEVLSRHAEERFWRHFQRTAITQEAPPTGYLAALHQSLLAIPDDDARRWRREALAMPTTRGDSHPSLSERLTNLGVTATAGEVVRIASTSAADAWLGAGHSDIALRIDALFSDKMREGWYWGRQEHASAKQRRDELMGRRANETITVDERVELAQMTQNLDGDEAAIPLCEEAVASQADHAPALFLLGSLYLDRDDERGLDLLERAQQANHEARLAVQRLLQLWYDRHGRTADAKAADRAAWEREELERQAAKERSGLPAAKKLRRHTLSATDLATAQAALAAIPDIHTAAIASVQVTFLPERPFHIVAVRIGISWWKPVGEKTIADRLQQVVNTIGLPGQFLVIHAQGQNTARLAKAVSRQVDAEIYRRPKPT